MRQVGSITPFQGLSHYMHIVSKEQGFHLAMYDFGVKKCLSPSWSFWPPHSNWSDPLLGLQQCPLNQKSCSLTCQELGYVLRSTPPIKWIRLQEGNFLRCLQTLGASSGIASWATIGFWGGQPAFFVVPSFTFTLAFRFSCWDPLESLSQGGQDYHIRNNFNFSSGTAQLCWQNGWYILPTDLLLQLHLRFLCPIQPKTQPSLPILALHSSLLQLQCFPL